MKFTETSLKDAFVIEPVIFKDQRGFFTETYSKRIFEDKGFKIDFVQDNHSFSKEKGVLRGLHFQKPPHAQTKLVRTLKGSVYDVIVDLRKTSETFGKWTGVELSADNMKMLLVPKGFAHAFCTLEPESIVFYKVDEFYAPKSEGGIIWNDPVLDIDWPFKDILLSDKDRRLPLMSEIGDVF
ncbi:MAG TPA: dTDP-4-dehydrorhamnose 3,5-epimerase [Desulfomonilia bacterium]